MSTMAIRQVAALAALTCAATPSFAFETYPVSTARFYVSIPLGAPPKEQAPALGLAVQGRNRLEFSLDTRVLARLRGWRSTPTSPKSRG